MAKDVLEVLSTHLMQLCVETPEDQAHFDSMKDATAKLSELIAADVEYDELVFALSREKYNGEDSIRRWAMAVAEAEVRRAEVRRAAALAACRGL